MVLDLQGLSPHAVSAGTTIPNEQFTVRETAAPAVRKLIKQLVGGKKSDSSSSTAASGSGAAAASGPGGSRGGGGSGGGGGGGLIARTTEVAAELASSAATAVASSADGFMDTMFGSDESYLYPSTTEEDELTSIQNFQTKLKENPFTGKVFWAFENEKIKDRIQLTADTIDLSEPINNVDDLAIFMFEKFAQPNDLFTGILKTISLTTTTSADSFLINGDRDTVEGQSNYERIYAGLNFRKSEGVIKLHDTTGEKPIVFSWKFEIDWQTSNEEFEKQAKKALTTTHDANKDKRNEVKEQFENMMNKRKELLDTINTYGFDALFSNEYSTVIRKQALQSFKDDEMFEALTKKTQTEYRKLKEKKEKNRTADEKRRFKKLQQIVKNLKKEQNDIMSGIEEVYNKITSSDYELSTTSFMPLSVSTIDELYNEVVEEEAGSGSESTFTEQMSLDPSGTSGQNLKSVLSQQIEELETENEALKTENEGLKKTNNIVKVRGGIGLTLTTLATLGSLFFNPFASDNGQELQRLQNVTDVINSTNQNLTAENQNLQLDLEELSKKNEELKSDKEKYIQQNAEMLQNMTESQALIREHKHLEDDVKEWAIDIIQHDQARNADPVTQKVYGEMNRATNQTIKELVQKVGLKLDETTNELIISQDNLTIVKKALSEVQQKLDTVKGRLTFSDRQIQKFQEDSDASNALIDMYKKEIAEEKKKNKRLTERNWLLSSIAVLLGLIASAQKMRAT